MVPMHILTLIAAPLPSASFLVLQPEEETAEEGLSRVVPIRIGPVEAISVGAAMESARLERPSTHDLIVDILTNLDATVDHVLLRAVRGNVFYADLVLSQHGRLIVVDSRPTDAISLAVREGAPMFIDEEVLESASYPFLVNEDRSEEQVVEEFKSFLDDISPDDFAGFGE